MINVSVIVCCYNSELRIEKTLEFISKQYNGDLQFELVLVDNNCNDSTKEVALDKWNDLGSPFKLVIVEEFEAGLSFARKTGVKAAKGEIIVFCDDDNWLNENYLFKAYQLMLELPQIGVLAGQSRAIGDSEFPTWFYSYYERFACGVYGMSSGDVTSRKWVAGAGMIVRRKVLFQLYSTFSHKMTGRRGDELTSGEDLEICYWHILCGFKLWYNSDLLLTHYMPQSRILSETASLLFSAQMDVLCDLRKLSILVSENIQWRVSKFDYLKYAFKELRRLNIYNFCVKAYFIFVFLGIISHEIVDKARKIEKCFSN